MGFAKKLNQPYELHDSADMGPDRRASIPNSALLCATAMHERATLRAGIRAAWIDLLRRNRGAEERPDQRE
jgi:hypothetical protein